MERENFTFLARAITAPDYSSYEVVAQNEILLERRCLSGFLIPETTSEILTKFAT